MNEQAGILAAGDESDRQLMILALALTALQRPGFDLACGAIADRLSGRAMFERFKGYNSDRSPEPVGDVDRAGHVPGAIDAGSLIRALLRVPPFTPVVLAKDREGNDFSPLDATDAACYVAETTYSGHLVDDDSTEEGEVDCVVLWPVN